MLRSTTQRATSGPMSPERLRCRRSRSRPSCAGRRSPGTMSRSASAWVSSTDAASSPRSGARRAWNSPALDGSSIHGPGVAPFVQATAASSSRAVARVSSDTPPKSSALSESDQKVDALHGSIPGRMPNTQARSNAAGRRWPWASSGRKRLSAQTPMPAPSPARNPARVAPRQKSSARTPGSTWTTATKEMRPISTSPCRVASSLLNA